MKKIGILIELKDGAVKEANYGVIRCAAQGMAHGDALIALMPGGDPQKEKARLESYGICRILDLGTLGSWNPVKWAEGIIHAMKANGIEILFGLTSPTGRELLPRIAAKLDAPLVMDCIKVSTGTGIARRFLYSGKTLATLQVKGAVQIYGVRPNVVAPVQVENPPIADVIAYDPAMEKSDGKFETKKSDNPENVQNLEKGRKSETEQATSPQGLMQLIERRKGDETAGSLQDAGVIVAGGRGMQNGENFALLRKCATLLDGEVAASRVAVDLGWVPYRMQVGQTGEKVSPKLYIACGLSGSVQHFAGMKMSGTIIAVNTHPEAAIMKNCDYAVEGDLFEVIPALTKALEKIIKG